VAAAAAIERPARRELALAALGLTLLGAAVFGPQVANGGFYWDDWANAANVAFSREPGLFGALDQATERPVFGYRPVLTTMLVLEYEALGLEKPLFLAAAVLFGISTAWALYLLLRTLGLEPREALPPAALLLVFPWTDSTRMWNTASFDTLAVTFYLLGLVVAVRALRSPPGRRRALVTAGSLALYLAAAWTYEIVAIAVLASVAVYLLVAPRRDALRRLALDAVVVGVALGVVAAGTTRTPLGLADQVEHALTIAGQAFSMLARALVPAGEPPGIVGAVVLAAIVGAALASRRPELRRWLAAAGLGALGVAAGWALFIPAASYYEPLAPGTTNRMNVLAAAGFAVLVYALVRLASGLVAGSHAATVSALLLIAIGAGYVVQVRDDQEGWQRSDEVQDEVLAAVRAALPDPPEGATVYTFNAAGFVAPGIPAFSLSFDLRAAVRLEYDDPSLFAYPIRGLDVIRCLGDSLHPVGGTYGPVHGAGYGEAWFVNVRRRAAVRIDDAAQCRRWARLLSA
jgi:hypothetical protein